MYLPFLIFFTYIYSAVKNCRSAADFSPSPHVLICPLLNILLTEICYYMFCSYVYASGNFSFLSIVIYLILQDAYRYVVHKGLHKYFDGHSDDCLDSDFAAWNQDLTTHVFLNIGSIFVPFFLVNIAIEMNGYLLPIFIIIYISMTSNKANIQKHLNNNENYGTLCIFDNLFK